MGITDPEHLKPRTKKRRRENRRREFQGDGTIREDKCTINRGIDLSAGATLEKTL
jgi:hypothetical protein